VAGGCRSWSSRDSGRTLDDDYLVIATGTQPRPDQTPGMLGPEWRRSVHEFYTLDGAIALRQALRTLARTGGRLVVHIVDMPIKCPAAARPAAAPACGHVHGRQTSPGGERKMPTASINDIQVHVDAEGFLTDYDEWDESLACDLAAAIGIDLTPRHWLVIRFLRADYLEQGETATLRRVSTATGVPIRQLFELFPGKPAKKMAYIAGLPKPHGCV
jgi:tRNA 2-thiouridine synthesizing protein E